MNKCQIQNGSYSCMNCDGYECQRYRAYQQGRADAIEESKVIFRKYMMTKDIDGLDRLLEQLKERDT